MNLQKFKDVVAEHGVSLVAYGATFAGVDPFLAGTLSILQISYLFLKELVPDETEVLIKELQSKIESKELLSSKELQQAITLTIDTLISNRPKSRRQLIKKVFFNEYISVEMRESVELERFYRTITDISLSGLEFLVFIKDVIIPNRDAHILPVAQSAYDSSPVNVKDLYGLDWQISHNKKMNPISNYIQEWVYDNYGTNSFIARAEEPDKTIAKEHLLWEKKHTTLLTEKSDIINEQVAELKSLGILNERNNGYAITKFGEKIINLLSTYIVDEENS